MVWREKNTLNLSNQNENSSFEKNNLHYGNNEQLEVGSISVIVLLLLCSNRC